MQCFTAFLSDIVFFMNQRKKTKQEPVTVPVQTEKTSDDEIKASINVNDKKKENGPVNIR